MAVQEEHTNSTVGRCKKGNVIRNTQSDSSKIDFLQRISIHLLYIMPKLMSGAIEDGI